MKFLPVFFLIFVSTNLFPQVVTKGPVTITFVNLPKKIAELKKVSVSIEKSNIDIKSPTLIGSGFLVQKNENSYAVTNYHVIDNIKNDQIILIGLNIEMKKHYALVKQKYLDEKNDIAVLKLGRLVSTQDIIIDSTLAQPATIGLNFFEESSDIIEGRGAIIIGYPLGIGSEFTGNKPVSRIGIVAQGPNNETNTFLLDGIVSHGNSGSPVFNEQTMHLMGMVTSFRSESINLYDNSSILRASLPYNSGIAICVTAEMINKIIP
jgi:S1-C subfamily serine protease